MQQEFVERVDFFVFDDVEIGIVVVAADFVAVGFVPFGVFYAEIFGRDELGVELYAVVFAAAILPTKVVVGVREFCQLTPWRRCLLTAKLR